MNSRRELTLGSDENGIRFRCEQDEDAGAVGLAIDVWDADWHEAASVTLNAAELLTLAQTLDDWLGR